MLYPAIALFAACSWLILQGADADKSPPHPRPIDIRIDPSSYEATGPRWTGGGPHYEEGPSRVTPGMPHAYVRGNGAGQISYRVALDEFVGGTAVLGAYLSAGDRKRRVYDKADLSELHVFVNGSPLAARLVAPDDGEGYYFEWSFSTRYLTAGVNVIEMRVDPGARANGLSVYGKAITSRATDRWITLRSR